MFAYVKILESPHSGTKAKIAVANIKYTFKSCDDFDRKKKYYVTFGPEGNYYKAQIIFLKRIY